MTTQPDRIEYPISRDALLVDPIVQTLYSRSQKSGSQIKIDPTKGPMVGIILQSNISDVIQALNEARNARTVEPLLGLLNLALPEDYKGEDRAYKEMVLKPYKDHLRDLRKGLSDNIRFEVQEVDPLLGDALLARGKLLFSSKNRFVSWGYKIFEDSKIIGFEKLPELKARDLEEAVNELHEPNLIESIVRVRANQPYSVKKVILPHFGYQLLGR